jgi:hypothetical protein
MRPDEMPFIKTWGRFAQIRMLEFWKNGKWDLKRGLKEL